MEIKSYKAKIAFKDLPVSDENMPIVYYDTIGFHLIKIINNNAILRSISLTNPLLIEVDISQICREVEVYIKKDVLENCKLVEEQTLFKDEQILY